MEMRRIPDDRRLSRGKHVTSVPTVRLKVNLNVRIPGTWSEFLRDNTNTMELFKYLTEEVMQRLYSGIYNYRYVQWNGVIPYRREPYRRVPLGRVHLDERRLDEVQ